MLGNDLKVRCYMMQRRMYKNMYHSISIFYHSNIICLLIFVFRVCVTSFVGTHYEVFIVFAASMSVLKDKKVRIV